MVWHTAQLPFSLSLNKASPRIAAALIAEYGEQSPGAISFSGRSCSNRWPAADSQREAHPE